MSRTVSCLLCGLRSDGRSRVSELTGHGQLGIEVVWPEDRQDVLLLLLALLWPDCFFGLLSDCFLFIVYCLLIVIVLLFLLKSLDCSLLFNGPVGIG